MLHHSSSNQAVAEKEAVEFFSERLESRIKKGASSCSEILRRIDEDGKSMEDFLVPWGQDQADVRFRLIEGHPAIHHKSFGARKLHPHATAQAAAKLGMPSSWIRDMSHSSEDWQKDRGIGDLDAFVQNTKPVNVLVRSIGDEVRGILSDRYRRLDSSTILASFLRKVDEEGGAPIRAALTPTRVYVEAALPQVFPIETPKNGTEYVAAGVIYRTSDFGDGADCVSGWLERLWCTNKVVATHNLRQIHLGSKMAIESGFRPSRKTYVHDTMTHASLVSDVVSSVLSSGEIKKHIDCVQKASDEEVSFDRAAQYRLPKAGLTQSEIASVQSVLLDNSRELVPDGPLTLWKLSQAVSAVAQQHALARRSDLEELAGKLVFNNN